MPQTIRDKVCKACKNYMQVIFVGMFLLLKTNEYEYNHQCEKNEKDGLCQKMKKLMCQNKCL
jgi:hypothetical protein